MKKNNGMLYFGMCFIKMKLMLDMVIFYIENFVWFYGFFGLILIYMYIFSDFNLCKFFMKII